MGKINPVGTRLGYSYNWGVCNVLNGYNIVQNEKYIDFLNYVVNLFNLDVFLRYSLIFSDVKINVYYKVVRVEVNMYQAVLLPVSLGYYLAYIEALIIRIGCKIYNRPVKLYIRKVNNTCFTVNTLSRYILGRGCLGVSIENVFRELKEFMKKIYRWRILLGYRISIKGRYSRRRRTFFYRLVKGPMPVQNHICTVFVKKQILLTKFGISTIKILFYVRNRLEKYKNRQIIVKKKKD